MVCIYCSSETYVTNSRYQKRSNNVWRRRTCTACHAVFSTGEQADYEKSWVVQYRDPKNPLLPFLRDKLFISIHKSVQHRATALQDAIGLTDTVIHHIAKEEIRDGGLRSETIAQAALTTLKRFDQPAAISYQAFHADVL